MLRHRHSLSPTLACSPRNFHFLVEVRKGGDPEQDLGTGLSAMGEVEEVAFKKTNVCMG